MNITAIENPDMTASVGTCGGCGAAQTKPETFTPEHACLVAYMYHRALERSLLARNESSWKAVSHWQKRWLSVKYDAIREASGTDRVFTSDGETFLPISALPNELEPFMARQINGDDPSILMLSPCDADSFAEQVDAYRSIYGAVN